MDQEVARPGSVPSADPFRQSEAATSEAVSLTADQIVETAVKLLNAEGAASLSMRRLGDALGVTAPALYRHVRSKGDLTDLVLRRVMNEFSFGVDIDEPWDRELARLMREVREHLLRFPWVTELSQGAHVPGLHTLGDTVQSLLVAAGLSEAHVYLHRRLMFWSVWGFVTTELELARRSTHVPLDDGDGGTPHRRYRVTLAGDVTGTVHRLPEPYDVVDLEELFDANVRHFVSGVRSFASEG